MFSYRTFRWWVVSRRSLKGVMPSVYLNGFARDEISSALAAIRGEKSKLAVIGALLLSLRTKKSTSFDPTQDICMGALAAVPLRRLSPSPRARTKGIYDAWHSSAILCFPFRFSLARCSSRTPRPLTLSPSHSFLATGLQI